LGLIAGKNYRFTEILGGDNIESANDFNVTFNEEGAYLYRISLK
jgi:hypothetical protein